MPSFAAEAVKLYIRYGKRSKEVFGSPDRLRKEMHDVYVRPDSFSPPAPGEDLEIERIDVNDWPLYRISLKGEQTSPRSAIIYAHGGAWFREIQSPQWTFVMEIARETKLDIIVPIYPLVPRPAATAAEVIPTVVKICETLEQPIVGIMGDSAGGTITLATAQHMRKAAPSLFERLKFLVMISPALDLAFNHPEVLELEKGDPWLGVEGTRIVSALWAGDLPMTDPLVSPLFGDIEHLPPVMTLVGTADLICGDTRRLNGKFQGKGHGTPVAGSYESERFKYVEAKDMIHVYPILPIAEATEARKDIVAFISKHTQGA